MSNQFRTKAELKRAYCDRCDKSFSRSDTLTLHKKRAHPKVEPLPRHLPFACPECKKVYAKSSIFTKHMQMVHGRTHFFDCVECDGSFRYIKSLKAHYHHVHEQRRNTSNRLPRKRASTSRRSASLSKQRKGSSSTAEQSDRNEPALSSSEEENTELDDDQWYTALKQEHATTSNTDATAAATAVAAAVKQRSPKSDMKTEDEASSSSSRAGLFSVLEQKFERDDTSVPSLNGTELETPSASGSSHEDEDDRSAGRHTAADTSAAPHSGNPGNPVLAEDCCSTGDSDGEVNVVIPYESVSCCSPGPPQDPTDTSAACGCRRSDDQCQHSDERSDDPAHLHHSTPLPVTAASMCLHFDVEQASETLPSGSLTARPMERPTTPTPSGRYAQQDVSSPTECEETKRAQLLLPSPIRFCKLLDEQ